MVNEVKDFLKALCMEYQLGYPMPRTAQECVDLANSVLQSAMLEFVPNDRITQSSINVGTQNGFRVAISFEGEEEKDV